MWRYTSIHDLLNMLKACVSSSVIIVITLIVTVRFSSFPRSIFVIEFFLTLVLLGGFRLAIKLFHHHTSESPGRILYLYPLKVADPPSVWRTYFGTGTPTDHWVKESQGVSPGMFFSSSDGLRKAERAFYEYLGLTWPRIRGQS